MSRPLISAVVAELSTEQAERSYARAAPGEDHHCFHCGLANPPGARWRAELAGATRTFCCAGCRAVAQTIHSAGLEAFYAQRTASGPRPEPDPPREDEWSAWDAHALQAGVVRRPAEDRAEISLLLEGVQCSACTWLIEQWLAREPGVMDASVNYATRRAQVAWDPSRRRLSDLLRAVASIGYRAFPYDPARREALAQRESRALLLRTAVAVLAMMQVMMFAVPTYITIDGVEPAHQRLLEWASLTLALPAILYAAWPFFRGAWRDLVVRRLGMDVPIALGLGAAFAASAWATLSGSGAVYYDSVTMFIALLLVARYVEFLARRRAGDAIEAVARARPATAERLLEWPARGETQRIPAAALQKGHYVLVRAGEIMPADGAVVEGSAAVEEAVLTGEARPRGKAPGDVVLAGSIARDGALVVRVTAAGDATQLAAIERLVERSQSERPSVARVADRIAARFVGVLLLIAAATAGVWTLVDPAHAIGVVFAVLAVSCPCALSLATPAAIAAATGALSRQRTLVARADALETLSRVTHVVFDKTGTLTSGRSHLLGTYPCGGHSEAQVLALAAALEAQSEHPLARALRDAAGPLALPRIEGLRTVPGEGVEGILQGHVVRLGRSSFVGALTRAPLQPPAPADAAATVVALGDDAHGVLAFFALGDPVRPGARALIASLHAMKLTTVLLSGDRSAAVQAMRNSLGIMEARGEMRPDNKREAIVALQRQGAVVAMVGDGINDAPALAQAQVSLSLGSATPLAQWAADVVVLSDQAECVGAALAQARRAMRIVRQNLAWAFGYNALAIPAAAFGLVSPLVAAVGMSLSSILVVGNALRAARFARPGPLQASRPAAVLAAA